MLGLSCFRVSAHNELRVSFEVDDIVPYDDKMAMSRRGMHDGGCRCRWWNAVTMRRLYGSALFSSSPRKAFMFTTVTRVAVRRGASRRGTVDVAGPALAAKGLPAAPLSVSHLLVLQTTPRRTVTR